MRNEDVATEVQARLEPGERVVSTFGPYYATSSRVLLRLETETGAVVHELPYSRIEKIEQVKVSDHRMMAMGAVLAIAGFIASFGFGWITPLIAVFAGIALVFYGGTGKPAYYQLHGRGMSAQELLKWRIRYRGAGSFIASIRTIRGERL
jgi:hypothetical protein